MFRALCAHHQEVKIVLYSIWYHHTGTVITPEKFIHKYYCYVLIFIEMYFSNVRPLACFSVTIPDAV